AAGRARAALAAGTTGWHRVGAQLGKVLAGDHRAVSPRGRQSRAARALPAAAVAADPSGSVLLPYAIYLSRYRVSPGLSLPGRARRRDRIPPARAVPGRLRRHGLRRASPHDRGDRPARAAGKAAARGLRPARALRSRPVVATAGARARALPRADRV